LKGLSQVLSRFLSDHSLSGQLRTRKDQLPSAEHRRIKYRKIDAEIGEDVESAGIINGYEIGKGEYIEPGQAKASALRSGHAQFALA
jgi:non-homologous end joining protein Ku